MNLTISEMEDAIALRVLKTIVSHALPSSSVTELPDSALFQDLAEKVEAKPILEHVSDADVARSALQLLASNDPEMEHRIVALAAELTQKFLDPTTGSILLVTAVVIVLKTKVNLRYEKGTWTFELGKPSIATGELRDFLAKVIPWYRSDR
jgi:hypothetical protein